jgi:restriction system protein
MATPTWDELVHPTLELACKEPITRQSAKDYIYKVVPMTKEEQEERLKSGTLKVGHRASWAMSHLTKAGLIEKVAKATYKATDKGQAFMAKHIDAKITYEDLKGVEGYQEAWKSASQRNRAAKKDDPIEDTDGSDNTPEESIDGAVEQVESNLRSELLEQLASVDPYRFEQVVIDLLFAMGYGGSRTEAAQVTKKSNDEGIDGVINEDRLGLDVIYVQAKRWKENVGRKEIQSFVGALAGKQANKGVFITTSDFRSTAIDYADNVQQRVILINGSRLADLMIEHSIGVSTIRTIELKRIDSDYFED